MSSSVSTAGTWQLMWRLTLPVLAEEFLNLLVGYTDWWLAGHYLGTADHLAAMSLLAYVMWLLSSFFSTVAIGATALVARFAGADDKASASRVVGQAVVAGSAIAVVLTLAAWIGGRAFIELLQIRGHAGDLVWQFLRILIPAIPFIMLEQVCAACLRGAGDTVSGFIAKSIVNLVNMAVSPVLLLGIGPFPELGWQGIAIGTASAHCLGGILLVVILLRGRAGMRLRLARSVIDRPLLRRLLHIGVPGGIDILSVLTCHLTYVGIINSLGTAASAAHGLGLQIEALSYLPGVAFHVAAATLAGQYLGAGDSNKARHAVLITCLTGCTIMSCAAVAFVLAGEWLAAFFTGDRHNPAAQHAAQLLKIVAISTPSLGVLSILTGGLRGAGDTRWPLLITFIGLLGVRLPGACLLAPAELVLPGLGLTVTCLGWGVDGTWWAMTADVIVRSLLVLAQLLHGGWRRIHV